MKLDATHDPARRSWVASANDPDSDFPLQNLPLASACIDGGLPRPVTAIGDCVLDLDRAAARGLLNGAAADIVAGQERLNRLLARPAEELTGLRHALAALLERGSPHEAAIRADDRMLRDAREVTFVTPTQIGSFTDFFAGIHHARAASRILVPGGDIGPNYRWVPIAYQSRASTVAVSGAPVRRPGGQLLRDDGRPEFAPSENLDFELELGFYVSRGNSTGRPIPIEQATNHIAGFCLLNDWSARDIQRWEMAPLGPFLSKSFATTISPWVITMDALAPFRIPAMAREPDDPAPLPYLNDATDQAEGGIAIQLSVWLQSARMSETGEPAALLLRSDARHLYWTPSQMLTHHTSNGCSIQPGDLLGTGTISGPDPEQLGSLLELTDNARRLASLPDGEQRGFLEDGDTVTFAGRCAREDAVSIGLGRCTGTIIPTEEP